MRSYKKIITGIAATIVAGGMYAQEYDDMYFTKADRKSKFTNAIYNETSSFKDADAEPIRINRDQFLSEDSYSEKNLNPDYISKYKSKELDENADPEDESTYYVENKATARSSSYSGTYSGYNSTRYWNYYGLNPYRYSSFRPYSYYSYGYYDPYWDWDPYWGYCPNFYSRWSIGITYSWGSGFYRTYYPSWYYRPYYSSYYYSGYYSPYRIYSPYRYYNNTYVYIDNSDYSSDIAYRPRRARNTANIRTNNTSTQRPSRTVSLNSNDDAGSRGRTVSNEQGTFYRRSRTRTNVSTQENVSTTGRTSYSGVSLNEINTRNTYQRSELDTRTRTQPENNIRRRTENRYNTGENRRSYERPRSEGTRTDSYNRNSNNTRSRSYSTPRSNSSNNRRSYTPSRRSNSSSGNRSSYTPSRRSSSSGNRSSYSPSRRSSSSDSRSGSSFSNSRSSRSSGYSSGSRSSGSRSSGSTSSGRRRR